MEPLLEQRVATAVMAPLLTADGIRRPATERQLHLYGEQTSDLAVPQPIGIHHLVTAHAAHTPHAVAVISGKTRLTYAALNERANQLAATLRARGVGPEVLVGLCLPRSIDLIVAALGVLKTGGAYVPLDPAYPSERLRFMLGDAKMPILLTQQDLAAHIPTAGNEVLFIDRDQDSLASDPASNVNVEVLPEHIAYVIYTSGSTGRPKGVAVSHQGLSNLVFWHQQAFAVTAHDRATLIAGVGFDASVWEIWPYLTAGASIAIPDEATRSSPASLRDWLVTQKVTISFLPTPLAEHMLALEWPCTTPLRLLLTGGDKLLQRPSPRLPFTLINNYGPTECTVVATSGPVSSDDDLAAPSIGLPITNTQAYVLDDQLQPVPPGTSGELYLGGTGLARGYLNRPDLTAERFIPHPCSQLPGERVYRTGDLVRVRADKTLDFLGRIDQQVKVRGFRIELGEIETVLRQHPDILSAVVIARGTGSNETQLIAYFVQRDGRATDSGTLHRYLADTLPSYMLPTAIICLDALPLTVNGKVDRAALPTPTLDRSDPRHAYIAPRTTLEMELAAIWQHVLQINSIGVHDDFFELGGHSLLATQVVSRINQQYGVDLTLAALFDNCTIAKLAALVPGMAPIPLAAPIQVHQRQGNEPLSFAQQRLWFLDQLLPGSAVYNVPFALRLRGELHTAALQHSLTEIVRRHEVLRTCFSDIQGNPMAVVCPSQPHALPIEDLSQQQPAECEVYVRERMRRDANQPFDLVAGPLLRTTLLRLGDADHLLLLNVHHICADGWSLAVFAEELAAHYSAFLQGQPSPLPDLPIQYADFARWQREHIEDSRMEAQLSYWQAQLSPPLPPLDLPTDRPRPPQLTFDGSVFEFMIPAELVSQISRLSHEANATLFMTLLAAFQLLLHRYAGNPDQVQVGIPIANRTQPALEQLIGFFVNTLVIRTDFTAAPTFRQLVQQVRKTTLEAYDHQEAPFDKVVERLSGSRDPSRSPLVQIMFVMQNAGNRVQTLPNLSIEFMPTAADVSRFDLTFSLTQRVDDLAGLIEYNTALFDYRTIERLAEHFTWLLTCLVAAPDSPLPAIIEALTPPARAGAAAGTTAKAPLRALDVAARRDRLSPRKEALLQGLLRQAAQGGARSGEPVISRRAEVGPSPLSFAQQRLWFLHHLESAANYNVVVAIEMRGQVDLAVLERSFNEVVRRHEILRTTFILRDQEPVQVVAPVLHIPLCIMHLEALAPDAFRTNAEQQVHGEMTRRFDLASGPLVYLTVLCGAERTYRLIINLHHIIADAWSVDILTKEMGIAYEAINRGQPCSLPPLPIQYADFALWQRQWLRGAVFERQLAYWKERLAGLAASLPLPMTRARPAVPSNRGASSTFTIPAHVATALHVLSHQTHTTHFMVYLAAFQSLLAQLSGQTDIAVGSPIANRQHPETEPLIGFFLNTLVLRTDLSGDPSFIALLERVKTMTLEAQSHQDLPFERLVEELNPPRDPGCTPLFQVMFVHNSVADLPASPDAAFTTHIVPVEVVTAKFDLTLLIIESANDVIGTIEYRTDLFDAAAITGLSDHFLELLALVVHNPAQGVTSLPLFTPEEQARLHDKRTATLYLEPEVTTSAAAPRDDLEADLVAIWRSLLLPNRPIGITDDFFGLGGHSLLAMRLINEVHRQFNVEVSLRRFFEMPTIAALAAAIAESGYTSPSDDAPITAVAHDAPLPLSFGQQRIWFLHQLEINSSYNTGSAFWLRGPLAVEVLQRSFNEVVRRHAILRTRYVLHAGEPFQEILPVLDLPLLQIDLRDLPVGERMIETRRLASTILARRFDLGSAPLMTAALLQVEDDVHLLILALHHSIADAWSLDLLSNEISLIYQAFSRGASSSLPEPLLQYADFAVWQRTRMQGRVFARQLSYWTQQLSGLTPLALPTDHPRPSVMSYRGATYTFQLPSDVATGLRASSRRHGVTLFMVCLAAFKALLQRCTGQTDIAVGTPISNRSQPGTENLVGFFLNTLVLRTDLAGDPTFVEVLRRVRDVTLDAFAHQELPFERLVEELQSERDMSRAPLFQVMFVLRHLDAQQVPIAGLSTEPFEIEYSTSKFDLTLFMVATGEGLTGMVEYSTDLFEEATIVRMSEEFMKLLCNILTDPESRIGDLPVLVDTAPGPLAPTHLIGNDHHLLMPPHAQEQQRVEALQHVPPQATPPEREQLLVQWNTTQCHFPPSGCLHELVAAQVERSPNAIAVMFEQASLTYRQLDQRANQLAHYLQALGVGPDVLVAICMERSLEMVVGLLAILKAGGAYIPLDPAYPQERLALMLTDAQVPLLLTHERVRTALPPHTAHVVSLDGDWLERLPEPTEPPRSGVTGDHIAYVIYTSGSTGRPKGVMISHHAICNHMLWMQQTFPLEPTDRVLQKTPFSFDASVWEFYAPLIAGAQLILARPGGHQDTAYLVDTIVTHNITTLQLVPSLLQVLLETRGIAACTSLRRVFCGGEALPAELYRRLTTQLDAAVINLYGPTEAAIDATFYACDQSCHEHTIPIGRPISNTQIYLLDAELQPVPVGISGELYIGGAGLARGYLHRPDLTAERFVPSPFVPETPEAHGMRLYRTGDLARYRPDGSILFLGRIDQQVKVRGFRIELQEVEMVLAQHPAVHSAAVITPDSQHLVAYVVVTDPDNPQISATLRQHMRSRLPEYMVPTRFIVLDALPLTPSGKINRHGLPVPTHEADDSAPFVAPRDELEEQIVEIWQRVLQRAPLGVTSNFFALGGHSLMAVRLVVEMQAALGKEVPLTTLFQNPTIEQLASILRENAAPPKATPLVGLRTHGRRAPLFVMHPGGGQILAYRHLVELLPDDQPVYGLQASALALPAAAETTIEEMATNYLTAIRSVAPNGPYLLSGWSLGGLIAFEMAQQLQATGEKVELLAMIDTYAPRPELISAESAVDESELVHQFIRDLGLDSTALSLPTHCLDAEYFGAVTLHAVRLGKLPPETNPQTVSVLFDLFRANYRAMLRYRPHPYHGAIQLIRATATDDPHVPSDLGWRPWVRGTMTIDAVKGNHFTIMQDPSIWRVASLLTRYLEAAQVDGTV